MNAPIDSNVLEIKSIEFATELNMPDFEPTQGWLSRWKARQNISFKKCHGEKTDADQPAAADWLSTILPGILEEYEPKNIYNADETQINMLYVIE